MEMHCGCDDVFEQKRLRRQTWPGGATRGSVRDLVLIRDLSLSWQLVCCSHGGASFCPIKGESEPVFIYLFIYLFIFVLCSSRYGMWFLYWQSSTDLEVPGWLSFFFFSLEFFSYLVNFFNRLIKKIILF